MGHGGMRELSTLLPMHSGSYVILSPKRSWIRFVFYCRNMLLLGRLLMGLKNLSTVLCLFIYTTSVVGKTEDGSASVCTCDMVHNPTPDCRLAYVRQGNNEWSGNEIVKENGEKTLMCEVQNFCDLQWFHDDMKEPIEHEPGIIELQDLNQKLVLPKSRLGVDDGLYTCTASQGNHVLEPRNIQLHIIPEDSGMVVILNNDDCQAKMADIGDSAMFYCEFSTTIKPFVLYITWSLYNETAKFYNLVDYLNEENRNDPEVTTQYEDITSFDVNDGIKSEPFWIYNSTLFIHNISKEAFGDYRIKVLADFQESDVNHLNLTENPKPPVDRLHGLTVLVATVAVAIILLALLEIIYFNTRRELKLYWKDHYSNECKNDGKESDVYISYSHESEEDLNFVANVLKVELEKRGYVVIIRDIDHRLGSSVHDEIVQSLETCRRCIMIISPDYLTSWIGDYDVSVMMDRMGDNYKRLLIPIMYRDISEAIKTDQNQLLQHILNNVRCLKCPNTVQMSEVKSNSDNTTQRSSDHHETNNIQVSQVTLECSNNQGSKVDSEPNYNNNENSKKVAKRKDIFVKELLLRMPPRRFTRYAQGGVIGISMKTPGTRTSHLELNDHAEYPSRTTPPSTLLQNGQASAPSLYPNLDHFTSASHNVII